MSRPGRGRWDRASSREHRRAAQRASIVAASDRALAEHGRALTLQHIVEHAGVGRNTFYQHFVDVESALRAAQAERSATVERALDDAVKIARTPIERLRAIARAWVAAPLPRREDALGSDGASLALEASLRAALADARAVGAIGRAIEPVRLRCVVGAFEEAARLAAQGAASSAQIEDALVDFTLRAFR